MFWGKLGALPCHFIFIHPLLEHHTSFIHLIGQGEQAFRILHSNNCCLHPPKTYLCTCGCPWPLYMSFPWDNWLSRVTKATHSWQAWKHNKIQSIRMWKMCHNMTLGYEWELSNTHIPNAKMHLPREMPLLLSFNNDTHLSSMVQDPSGSKFQSLFTHTWRFPWYQ